jgi:hypothetical protein
MRLRLAGYARRWTPVSQEPTSRKALILGAIVAAHVGVLAIWLVAPRVLAEVWGIGEGSGSGTREVVRYFDISPESPTGQMQLPPELADSLGLAAPTTP